MRGFSFCSDAPSSLFVAVVVWAWGQGSFRVYVSWVSGACGWGFVFAFVLVLGVCVSHERSFWSGSRGVGFVVWFAGSGRVGFSFFRFWVVPWGVVGSFWLVFFSFGGFFC